MAAPTVIRWDDTGAPVLNNTLGSLIAVLDFCLLTRGWSKVFSDGYKAVYRADTGERKFYKIVDDASVIVSNYSSPTITGYDSMTDINTGAGWGYSAYIRKSYNDALVKRWVCLVDAAGFMIATQPHGGTGVDIALRVFVPHYIGETVSLMPGQTSRSVIAACVNTGSFNSVLGLTGSASYSANCNRSLDGTLSAVNTCIHRTSAFVGCSDSYSPPGNFNRALYPYPYNAELLYCRNFMTDTTDVNTIGDYLPWLYHTPQKGDGFANIGTVPAEDKTFMSMYVSVPYTYSGGGTGAISAAVAANATVWGTLLFCLSDSR